MGGKIIVVDTEHAWGYHCPQHFGRAGENPAFRRYIYFHDFCNGASILFSPLVAIARAIAAILLLINFSQQDPKKTDVDLDAAKHFCYMQLGRAVLELLCLGPILGTVIDAIMTLKHRKMLCFSDGQVN